MRKRSCQILFLSIAAVTLTVVPAFAQGRGRGHENDHGEHFRGHGRDHRRDRRADFREHDRGVILSYYRDHRSDLPPGLARREELPPGLERQLRRNGRLPPGLRRRIVWFPTPLNRRLGPLPEGYRRCWVGNTALVVNVRTFGILDVMAGFTLNFH